MKVKRNEPKNKAMRKDLTVVGEVYRSGTSDTIYFRCQGGFVVLSTGSFLSFSDACNETKWTHLPNAEIHTNE